MNELVYLKNTEFSESVYNITNKCKQNKIN